MLLREGSENICLLHHGVIFPLPLWFECPKVDDRGMVFTPKELVFALEKPYYSSFCALMQILQIQKDDLCVVTLSLLEHQRVIIERTRGKGLRFHHQVIFEI